VALSQEIEMRKVVFALVLLTSPAFAQTPNLAPAPPVGRVGDPVKCLPIGKTSKGDLVYSLDCRGIPISTGVNNVPEPIAPTVPATVPPAAPESK
jgi:hypothetical protein